MKAKKRKTFDFDESNSSVKIIKECLNSIDDEETKENDRPEQQMDFDADFDDDLDNDDDDLEQTEINNTFDRCDSPNQTFADSRVRGNGTEESMRREEQSHAYDRKLTRLIEQYPSIWCTMHPDYGNFEVTRKQWRTIAVHFKRSENIKLRWKNIRKRYVRIERRIDDGKRFTGYFDKATNFLSNRNLPMSQWKLVDCGADDGDTYARENLDAIEESILYEVQQKPVGQLNDKKVNEEQQTGRPIEVLPIDLKIINFVKRNPVLWRRVTNGDMHNQMAVRNLWQQLWRSMSGISFDDMIYRWHYLYEMYKTFRLKKIKTTDMLTSLELKYSKYLAKLYFLYKIDEQVMRSECTMLNDDLYELDVISEHLEYDMEEYKRERLQDAEDDKEFVLQLVRTIKSYPALWTMQTLEYNDASLRSQLWYKVANKLTQFKSFQNLKEEHNKDEIEIIETPTDTITIDSDDEVISSMPVKKIKLQNVSTPVPIKINKSTFPIRHGSVEIRKVPALPKINLGTRPVTSTNLAMAPVQIPMPITTESAQYNCNDLSENDLMLATQSILASMLEVDLDESDKTLDLVVKPQVTKKQPRKKVINKMNPAKYPIFAREHLETLKKNDLKLKSKCSVKLTRVDEDPKYAKYFMKKTNEQEDMKNDENDVMIINETEEVENTEENKVINYCEEKKKIEENEVTIINDPIPECEGFDQETLPTLDIENIMPANIIVLPTGVEDMMENKNANIASEQRLPSLEITESSNAVINSSKDVNEQDNEKLMDDSKEQNSEKLPENSNSQTINAEPVHHIEKNSESVVDMEVETSNVKDVLNEIDSLSHLPINVTDDDRPFELHNNNESNSVLSIMKNGKNELLNEHT